MGFQRAKELPAEERLIFALDVATPAEARELVRDLKGEVGIFKIGLEVFLADGPELIRFVGEQGGRVFLDLKMLDIPATVAKAMAVVAGQYPNVVLATIHAFGQPPDLKDRTGALANLHILAVTLLTSMGQADLDEAAIGMSVGEYVSFLSKRALAMGCDGVIASGQEARRLRWELGEDFLIVAPGIRPAWAAVADDDQQRAVTPREAILNGADYLVVGRPIRNHPEGPRVAARQVRAEIEQALEELGRS